MEVEFTCRCCGNHVLEEVMFGVTVSSTISSIHVEGCIADVDYAEQTNEGGDVEHYQCAVCGTVLVDEDGEEITDHESLGQWLLMHQALSCIQRRAEVDPVCSDEFAWTLHGEYYNLLAAVFNVDQAKQLIIDSPREVQYASVKGLKAWVTRPTGDDINVGSGIDWERIDDDPDGRIDTNFPLIGAHIADVHWIIDGWHRLAKGLDQGQTVFPLVMLTPEESEQVRER